VKARNPREAAVTDPGIEEGIFRLYRSRPEVAILLELMTDFDEGMQEWRYRTLFRPFFPELWAIRHRL
jgi:tryptophan 2,3-dioxygenase